MRSIFKTITRIPWYVFLLAVYPVLGLFSKNVSEVQASTLWRPLLISLSGALIFLVLFRLIFRDWNRAALLVAIVSVMFFMYGHVYESLKLTPFLLPVARHRILLPIWGVLFGIGFWLAARKKSQPVKMIAILNIVAVIAIAFPLFKLGMYYSRASQAQMVFTPVELPTLSIPEGKIPPDIYYIILDAYGSSRVLSSLMDYDNSGLLDQLRAQGFFIANCSQSNYAFTSLSMVSSLNFNYLEAIDPSFVRDGEEENIPLYLKGNGVRYSLEELGYKTVAFETGFEWSEIHDADLYLSPSRWQGWNEFEALLVTTSILRSLDDFNLQHSPTADTSAHRERVLFALESLKELPSVDGPKFVFAHLIIPHDPQDIGPEGEYIDGWDSSTREGYYEGYIRQAAYLEKVLPEVTAAILANSPTPPIIIIQGDHGPWDYRDLSDRLGILNAYYLPGGSDALYATITPVNTFRVIFNAYFGGDLELLEDHSYFSRIGDPFNLDEVLNPCIQE
jgi:hypothetical protein